MTSFLELRFFFFTQYFLLRQDSFLVPYIIYFYGRLSHAPRSFQPLVVDQSKPSCYLNTRTFMRNESPRKNTLCYWFYTQGHCCRERWKTSNQRVEILGHKTVRHKRSKERGASGYPLSQSVTSEKHLNFHSWLVNQQSATMQSQLAERLRLTPLVVHWPGRTTHILLDIETQNTISCDL